MNYYDNDRTYEDNINTPATQPVQKQSNPSKRILIATLCACVLTSSILGFGGGMLASEFSANNSATTSPVSDVLGTPLRTPSAAGGTVMTVSQIAGSAADSVVEITIEVTTGNMGMMGRQQTATGAGSGVILSQDGFILTNNHVIEGAQTIQVRLKDGISYPATLVGTDEQTDVAVLKVEATGLQAAKIGDSSALQVGDMAVAIGNPLGELGGTVTNGIISALDREITLEGETMNLLQTNAAINPGNSGGGLFNGSGELIGIVVAKSAGSGVEGLGFAIPIDDAKTVADELMRHGYVTGRGYLGVSVIDINDIQTAFQYRVSELGVYIASIEKNSAAQLAGLEVGDRIVAINDTEVSGAQEFKTALSAYASGESITLSIRRDDQSVTINATLHEKDAPGTLTNT